MFQKGSLWLLAEEQTGMGYEGNQAAQAGVAFLPHHSLCIPPKAVFWVKEDDLP